jgi:hypothetical protein
MKLKISHNLFIYFILLLGSVGPSDFTQAQHRHWSEDYGVENEIDQPISIEKELLWLYHLIIPEYFRVHYPDPSYKSFRVHLKDTFQKFPEPQNIKKSNLQLLKKIEGHITYVGIVQKRYAHDLLTNSKNEVIFNVRIHFKDPMSQDIPHFQRMIKAAENLWNMNRIKVDFSYKFQFQIVESPKEAHFSVYILDSTRGPYDVNWGRDWNEYVIAHEIGHMMGLGDEYKTISGEMDCLTNSLMCSAWSGQQMQHHYYFLLRRLVN